MNIRLALLTAAAAVVPAASSAQVALPIGSTASGTISGQESGEYLLDLEGPGFLAVIVRAGEEEDDLVLTITDDEGQVLLSGRSDQDLGGQMGAEQLLVQIPGGGQYSVVVSQNYGSSTISFEVGAAFLTTPMAAAEPDPDGKPSGATALEIDGGQEDSIYPGQGDGWDWYSVTATSAGVLTVLTRGTDDEGGDLRLDVFRAGDLREPVDGSDQDQNDVLANESVTLDVAAGETIYVKVAPSFMGAGMVSYRIAAGLIGD
jgi:hypothetical protein